MDKSQENIVAGLVRRSDLIAVFILLFGVLVLFLPVLSGKLGIFHDDQAMAEFPWHYFLARHFLKGEIPLWEPDTWCGAIPFYARYYADTYYFPLWPFYLLTRVGDLNQAYWLLSILPILLHYWLAAGGMYLFARRSIRLRPLPSLVAAWVYLFSPAFAYSYVWFPIVVVQAWLPWLLNLVVAMDRKPGVGKVAAVAAILALMFAAAQPPHLGYGILLAMILALGFSWRRILKRDFSRAARAPLQLILALVLSLLLAAVYCFSVLDALPQTKQHIDLTYEGVTGKDGSLPPLYLATLFVPHLFGSVTGRNIWGADISYEARYWEANLNGGLLLTFLALAGVCLALRGREGNRRLRFWAALAVGIWIFSLLCVLGRHTPFYRWFFEYVPVLSSFPFPIRYRLLQCVATAWLAGLGVEHLQSLARSGEYWPARRVWIYLAFASALIALALLWPQDLTTDIMQHIRSSEAAWAFPGFREVFIRGEGGWFLSGPVYYFLSAALILILVWRGLRGRVRTIAVTILVMLETAGFAASALYFSTFEHRFPRPEHFRSIRPSSHPMIRRVFGPFAALRSDPLLRWATDQPFHDNFARLEGSFALMGYDMKPLEERFKEAIEESYGCSIDWPIYWFKPRAEEIAFLNHMSVGYLLDSKPESPFAGGETTKLETSPPFYFHKNPAAFPRVFTIDRIVESTSEEQKNELVRGDLRRAVFMVKAPEGVSGKRLAVSGGQLMNYKQFEKLRTSDAYNGSLINNYFSALQSANQISRVDFTSANRIEVDIDVSKPAMMVLTEVWYPGWQALVDGEKVPLYRVNYLQRGIWLDRGEHQVELSFRPPAWKISAAISLISWSALVVTVLVYKIIRFRKSRFSR